MKKSLVLVATCGVLAAAVAIGSTLAYFTNSKTKTNVVTMGDVNISLIDTYTDPGIAVPNQTIDKTVQVKNTGKNAAYIRVKLHRYWTAAQDSSEPLELNNSYIEVPQYDNTNWYYDSVNDVYYYKNAVPSNELTSVLFTQIHISQEANNAYADKFGKVDVTAEAVQSDNFTPTIANGFITSWGNVTVEAVPAD